MDGCEKSHQQHLFLKEANFEHRKKLHSTAEPERLGGTFMVICGAEVRYLAPNKDSN
jgi:hypothetical protein